MWAERIISGRRRGYALALVMLLGMVAALSVAVLLEGSAQAARASQRAVDLYLRHHEQAGMRDMIGMALGYRALNVGDLRAEGSTKITLSVGGAGEVEVRAADGQGTILRTSGEGVAGVLRVAAEQAGLIDAAGTAAGKNTRERGPAKTSVNSAPRAVLEALFKAVDAEGPATAFANAVLEMRGGKRLTQADISVALRNAGTDPEVARLLEGMLTADPGLFRVRVESRGPGGAGRATRFEGLIQGDPRGGAAGAMWAFLVWVRLEDGAAWTPDEAFDAAER